MTQPLRGETVTNAGGGGAHSRRGPGEGQRVGYRSPMTNSLLRLLTILPAHSFNAGQEGNYWRERKKKARIRGEAECQGQAPHRQRPGGYLLKSREGRERFGGDNEAEAPQREGEGKTTLGASWPKPEDSRILRSLTGNRPKSYKKNVQYW